MCDEFFFQGIHAAIWILQGSMFSSMIGACMNWCKTSSFHAMLGRSNFGFPFVYSLRTSILCFHASIPSCWVFPSFHSQAFGWAFLFPCGSGHSAHWLRYVVPWFRPIISSLVVQPFRTMQSKISKRFEVFFHTPCSKKPSRTGWSVPSKQSRFEKKYPSRMDQMLPSVLATTPLSPHPSLVQCRCHGCNHSDHQGVLVWKPSKTRHWALWRLP